MRTFYHLAGGVSTRHSERIISGAQAFFERVLIYVTFRLERAHHEDDAYELGLIDVASYPYVALLEAAPTLGAAQDRYNWIEQLSEAEQINILRERARVALLQLL